MINLGGLPEVELKERFVHTQCRAALMEKAVFVFRMRRASSIQDLHFIFGSLWCGAILIYNRQWPFWKRLSTLNI